MKTKKIITLQDFARESLEGLVDYAGKIKAGEKTANLSGSSVLSLFLTGNVHSRIAMETACAQMNAKQIYLDCSRENWQIYWEDQPYETQQNSEHVLDVAARLHRYGDCLAVHHIPDTGHWKQDRQDSILKALGEKSKIPVINLGSTLFNPCQALADILTIHSSLSNLSGWKAAVVWTHTPTIHPLGNACSFTLAVTKLGMDLTIACPDDFSLDPAVLMLANKNTKKYGGSIEVYNNIDQAINGAHIIYAVPWRSVLWYADREKEIEAKQELSDWQITSEVMDKTDGAYLMCPAPVKRNIAVAGEVLDSNHCLVNEQAENWLHAQKSLLCSLIK